MNSVEKRLIQNDEAIKNLKQQLSQIVSILSESSLYCEGEYMEEIPRENEPTQEGDHLHR